MLFGANNFHIIVTVCWQFSIFTACLVLFPIFNNYIPEWQCENQPPSRNCSEFSYCLLTNRTLSYVDPAFYSAAMEFNWVCGSDAYYRTLQSQVQFLGMMTATLMIGFCTDFFGRRPVAIFLLTLSLMNQIVSAMLSMLELYLISRFLVGFAAGGVLITVHTHVMELLLPSQRMAVRAFANWGTARLLLTVICWIAQDWRVASLYFAVFTLPAAVIMILLPESPTWLYSKGKMEELRMAELRVRTLSFDKTYKLVMSDIISKNKTFWQLLRSPGLFRRLVVLWFMWFVASVCIYSTDFNSNRISGDFFLNQLCFCAVLIISKILLVIVDTNVPHFSRRLLHQGAQFMVCCAYISLSIMSIYNYDGIGVLIVNIIGTVSIEYTWDACYLCVVESMETSCRASATGSCSLIARFGGILAPMLTYASAIFPPAVYITVAVLSIVNLAISFFFLVCLAVFFAQKYFQKESKDVNLANVRLDAEKS